MKCMNTATLLIGTWLPFKFTYLNLYTWCVYGSATWVRAVASNCTLPPHSPVMCFIRNTAKVLVHPSFEPQDAHGSGQLRRFKSIAMGHPIKHLSIVGETISCPGLSVLVLCNITFCQTLTYFSLSRFHYIFIDDSLLFQDKPFSLSLRLMY